MGDRRSTEHGVDGVGRVLVQCLNGQVEGSLELPTYEPGVRVVLVGRGAFAHGFIQNKTSTATALPLNFICYDRVEPRQTSPAWRELAGAGEHLHEGDLGHVSGVSVTDPNLRKSDGPRSKRGVERVECGPISAGQTGHQWIEVGFADGEHQPRIPNAYC